MNVNTIPKEKKLHVTYRVEPGCLGPDGANYVVDFCQYAENGFINQNSLYVSYCFIPRFDKSLEEMEFSINKRRLSAEKAAQYMGLFAQTPESFEDNLQDQLTRLIDAFFDR